MGDVGEDWRAIGDMRKARKTANLEAANSDGWKVHTDYHWSRTLNGLRLDYWPSTTRFKFDGRYYTGGIDGFIKKRTKAEGAAQ